MTKRHQHARSKRPKWREGDAPPQRRLCTARTEVAGFTIKCVCEGKHDRHLGYRYDIDGIHQWV